MLATGFSSSRFHVPGSRSAMGSVRLLFFRKDPHSASRRHHDRGTWNRNLELHHDLGEQSSVVLTRRRARIGRVAVVLERSIDHPWQRVGGNAEGSETLW